MNFLAVPSLAAPTAPRLLSEDHTRPHVMCCPSQDQAPSLTLHSVLFVLLLAHYCSLNAEHILLGFFCLPWLFCLQCLAQMSRIS